MLNLTFALTYITRQVGDRQWKVKTAKRLLKSSLTALDLLYSNMLHIDGNVFKSFGLPSFTGAEKVSCEK